MAWQPSGQIKTRPASNYQVVKSMKHRALTLIELLLVMAIITVILLVVAKVVGKI